MKYSRPALARVKRENYILSMYSMYDMFTHTKRIKTRRFFGIRKISQLFPTQGSYYQYLSVISCYIPSDISQLKCYIPTQGGKGL